VEGFLLERELRSTLERLFHSQGDLWDKASCGFALNSDESFKEASEELEPTVVPKASGNGSKERLKNLSLDPESEL
jgi:hypothetical protein